jgi:hypothetical protein
MNDHRLDMTRLVLVVISVALAVACGSETKKGANPLEEAKAATADLCACQTLTCRGAPQQRFNDALAKITDEAQHRALSAAMSACLAKTPPGAWDEVRDEVCACKTLDCVALAQEKAARLAELSDPAVVRDRSKEIEECLVANDEGLRLLSALRDRACACTDKACADQARADLKAAGKTPTKFMERSMQIGVEIVECAQKHQ